jgi:hypothetical protein
VKGKEKKNGGGGVGWRGGGLGRLGRKEPVGFPLFFFFLFFNLFSKQSLNSIQIKILLNFSQNFIIFLEATQATKKPCKAKR